MLRILGSLLFVLCFTSLTVRALVVDPCENGEKLPEFLEVVGCDVQPCPLTRGKDVVMYMNFTADEPIETLKAEVVAKAIGVNINFPLPRPNACEELTNTHCPLEINEPAQYKLVMPVENWYPPISLKLTLYLLANGRPQESKFVCFTMSAKVN